MPYEVAVPVSRSRLRRPGRLDIVDGRTSRTQRALRNLGLRGFQPETTAALLAMWEATERVVFFDVGANAGLYASLCAHLHPSSRVVAFEPTPEIAGVAESIARANGLSVTVERLAVSDHDGSSTLYLSEKSDASNSLTEGFRKARGSLEVATTRLDSYVAAHGLRPTVVKIDVERHEDAVIEGAVETLRDHRPLVVVEILPRARRGGSRVVELLESLDYVLVPLHPPDGTTDGEAKVRDWMAWPRPGPPGSFTRRLRAWERAVGRCPPGDDVQG